MVSPARVLAVIAARAGSKGVPGKNLRPLGDRPLIAHMIGAARAARLVDRTIVSTEDDGIARVARTYGAETPYVRPADLSTDRVPLIAVAQHAIGAM